MVDISIVSGIINQLITGGAPPCSLLFVPTRSNIIPCFSSYLFVRDLFFPGESYQYLLLAHTPLYPRIRLRRGGHPATGPIGSPWKNSPTNGTPDSTVQQMQYIPSGSQGDIYSEEIIFPWRWHPPKEGSWITSSQPTNRRLDSVNHCKSHELVHSNRPFTMDVLYVFPESRCPISSWSTKRSPTPWFLASRSGSQVWFAGKSTI